MRSSWRGAAAAAALLVVPAARAHELTCEKTVNGVTAPAVFEVHPGDYPVDLTYVWTITNALGSTTSVATEVTESNSTFDLPFVVPLALPGGGSATHTETIRIDDLAECAAIEDAVVGTDGTVTVENTFTVKFDGGTDVCKAIVKCFPEHQNGEEACLTRTPGYWGNHPEVTGELLPVESCGGPLTTTARKVTGSAIEDLCSVGKDHKLYDSPQEAQLVRQCAAAALNIAASERLGGSCEEGSEVFARCCGSCATVPAGCIAALDEFNNSADTLLVDDTEVNLCKVPSLGISSCAADPDACKDARNNGYVNDREVTAAAASVQAGATGSGPVSVGCSGGPGGLLSLVLGTLGVLALRRRG